MGEMYYYCVKCDKELSVDWDDLPKDCNKRYPVKCKYCGKEFFLVWWAELEEVEE